MRQAPKNMIAIIPIIRRRLLSPINELSIIGGLIEKQIPKQIKTKQPTNIRISFLLLS